MNYVEHACRRRAELRAQRALMVSYMELRMQNNDMHGVMDATADIREIDARIAELELLLVVVA